MEKDTLHPQITAHRAGAKLGPENSLTALRRAVASVIAYAEIDAQLTMDGAVVIFHDADLLRLGNDPRIIAQSTLAQLREIELAGREHISTLEEFIASARGRIKLNIEMKEYGQGAALPLRIVEILRAKDFLGQAVVSSSSPELLNEVRRLEPRIPLGVVVCSAPLPAEFPFDFVSAHHEVITAAMVRKAHRHGSEVHAWTVNERKMMLRLLALGVDNLITDDPVVAKETLSRFKRASLMERWFLRWRKG